MHLAVTIRRDDDVEELKQLIAALRQRLSSEQIVVREGNRGKFPGEWGSQGFENMIQAGDDNWHP